MNTYEPYPVEVTGVDYLSQDSVLLTLKFIEKTHENKFSFNPGQFIELSLAGWGEIPVGIASAPSSKTVQVSVREVGNVSKACHRLEVGDKIGLRGPFGNGFEKSKIVGKDLLIISGGCGIPPMRSLLLDTLENKKEYGDIHFLYGARNQKELLFRGEYSNWAKKVNLLLTTDSGDAPVEGFGLDCVTGVVTNLLDEITLSDKMVACMCGPPIMYKFVIKKLLEMGMKPEHILVSLERRMKCGVGKCQHCTSGSKYVCLDGPVFTYDEITKDYGGL